jgi:hypothetical protein
MMSISNQIERTDANSLIGSVDLRQGISEESKDNSTIYIRTVEPDSADI